MTRSSKITRHANGQNCCLRLTGICTHDPEKVMFCHLNLGAAGKGTSLKAHDYLGFFGCDRCHAAYDSQTGRNAFADDVLRAVCETWIILVRDKIILIPEDTPKPKAVKPRKPKSERTPIQSNSTWPQGRKIQSRNTLRKERT